MSALMKNHRVGDLVWIPSQPGLSGSLGIVMEVSPRSLVVMFPELGVDLELARGWFAAMPVSGSLVPSWFSGK